jgi:hypothetical protein
MQVLYHASPAKDLKIIQPKKTLSNDKYIGDYVFATSNRVLAAMYLAVKGYATLMNAEDEPYSIICGGKEEYLSKDKGGAIYTVFASTFEATPQAGLERSEQVSKISVKPIEKVEYQSSIDAMREAGAKIYFVKEDEFKKLVDAKYEREKLASLRLAAV